MIIIRYVTACVKYDDKERHFQVALRTAPLYLGPKTTRTPPPLTGSKEWRWIFTKVVGVSWFGSLVRGMWMFLFLFLSILPISKELGPTQPSCGLPVTGFNQAWLADTLNHVLPSLIVCYPSLMSSVHSPELFPCETLPVSSTRDASNGGLGVVAPLCAFSRCRAREKENHPHLPSQPWAGESRMWVAHSSWAL